MEKRYDWRAFHRRQHARDQCDWLYVQPWSAKRCQLLVKDLQVNWTWGASYFETLLVDYDVCSNWCNWNYAAGVGNDPRENRYFNIMSQAQRYDPQGDYVRHWIPELSDLPGKKVHYPTEISHQELAASGVVIGEDYPKPLVGFDKWLY